jgi:hypothetical protein
MRVVVCVVVYVVVAVAVIVDGCTSVEVEVKVSVGRPMATSRLVDINTPAMTIAAATKR